MLRKKKYYKFGFTFTRVELIMYGNRNRSYCEGCIYKNDCCVLKELRHICEILTPVGYLGKTRYIIKERKDRK
jgi:hypothetical protein